MARSNQLSGEETLTTQSSAQMRLALPGLAIVIPAYNSASTIRETLASIQAQTMLNRISCVYLADDSSTDNTTEEARSSWHCGVPLSVRRNPRNQGERSTVNGLVGTLPDDIKWFFLIHADDIARPDWVEVMATEIDKAEPNVISLTASYDVLREDGRIEPGENFGLGKKVLIEGTRDSVRDTIERGCWFKVSSCAIRVDGFRQLSGFRTDMPQLGDWEFVLRALESGWSIEYIPLCLSVYRQSSQSVSSQSFQVHRDVREALRILERFRPYLSIGSMLRRYGYYLRILTRRSARSLLSLEFRRLWHAITTGIEVGHSFVRNVFTSRPVPGRKRSLEEP